jgi:hypothetical protein
MTPRHPLSALLSKDHLAAWLFCWRLTTRKRKQTGQVIFMQGVSLPTPSAVRPRDISCNRTSGSSGMSNVWNNAKILLTNSLLHYHMNRGPWLVSRMKSREGHEEYDGGPGC